MLPVTLRLLAGFILALSGAILTVQSPLTLKDAYKNAFRIGTAVNEDIVAAATAPQPLSARSSTRSRQKTS
jgi:hypothetical protein